MKEFYVNINTLDLCVQQYGNPSNRPILILHGWLDHAGSWEAVATALATEYTVFVLDQRGHGRSAFAPPSSHYHFPDYVADVQDFVRALNLSDFDLIGHSMGGTVASLYAAFGAVKPARLVLIEGLGPPHETEISAAERYHRHLAQRKTAPTHKTLPDLQSAAAKLQRTHPYLSTALSLKLAERLTTKTPSGIQWNWDPRHRHRSAVAFHLPRHLQALSTITSPTTLIFGEKSWYTQLPDLKQRVDAFTVPVHRHILNSGHNPHLEQPALLAQLLQEVLFSN